MAELIGDPDSIAREAEVLTVTVAANLRRYAKLKEAARVFGVKLERSRSVPLDVRQAWDRVRDVLRESRG